MATAVLCPQDCLPSTHNLHNSYISSESSETTCFVGVILPSPLPQYRATSTNSGGLPPGDGILSVPLLQCKARDLARKLSPLKGSSSSAFTPNSRMFHESSPSSVKSKLLRSASAILPTASAGLPPLAEASSKGRVCFNVEGNGPGKNNDRFQASAVKKLSNKRHRVGKKRVVVGNQVSNMMTDGKFEGSKFSCKILNENGPVSGEQPTDTMVRMNGKSGTSNSGKRPWGESSSTINFPVVTILQRPDSDEAAVKLLAKFFQSRGQQDLGCVIGNLETKPDSSDRLCDMAGGKETETHSMVVEFLDCDATAMNPLKDVSIASPPFVKSGAELRNIEECASADALNIAADALHKSKACHWDADCEEFTVWQRWAGPSYMNSPPPSALPLPRFLKKLMTVVSLCDGCLEQLEIGPPDEISTSTASLPPLYISLARQQQLNINPDAVATATKDLKRILNLNFCKYIL